MKLFRVLLLVLFSFSIQAQAPEPTSADTTRVYKFEIRDEIGPPAWRLTKLALQDAHKQNVDLILLILNTYGGLVDAADSIRTALLNSKIPVIVFIENNAASAGALISIACDSIYMKPGSTIGAATVVNQTGEAVPDKYQSYMRKKMRATAEENNRNPDIAEAMVDPDKEVEGISDKGKVLTFTAQEALDNGYCEAIVASYQLALEVAKIGPVEIIQYKKSSVDKVINWLIDPVISGILIMLIIGGIYFELQSPGLGFPIVAAMVGAALYFAPHYLEGLAENWEIIIFFVGIVLVMVELFAIPGFGVFGVSGIVLIIAGLSLSLIGNVGFNFTGIDPSKFIQSLFIVIISSGAAVAGSILLGAKLLTSHAFSRLVLNTVQAKEEGYVGTGTNNEKEAVGKMAETATVLRPSGKILIEGKLYDATAMEGFIEKGKKVIIEDFQTAQYFVRNAED